MAAAAAAAAPCSSAAASLDRSTVDRNMLATMTALGGRDVSKLCETKGREMELMERRRAWWEVNVELVLSFSGSLYRIPFESGLTACMPQNHWVSLYGQFRSLHRFSFLPSRAGMESAVTSREIRLGVSHVKRLIGEPSILDRAGTTKFTQEQCGAMGRGGGSLDACSWREWRGSQP